MPRAGASCSPLPGTGRDADAVTVLRSRGRRLAKLITSDGQVVGYDSALRFDMAEMRVAGLDGLERLLRRLLPRAGYAVVRGAILDPARTRGVRRLLHSDPKTGDLPTLREVPRRWLALDMGGLSLPAGTDPADLAACGAIARRALPPEFHGAACVVQATGSHGIKPGARLRVWFWCDRPVEGAEAKARLRGHPVDPAPFSAAQLIYTACPVFAPGRADHLPARMLRLPGAAAEVAFVAPAPRPNASRRTPPKPHGAPSRPAAAPSPRVAATAVRAAPRGQGGQGG